MSFGLAALGAGFARADALPPSEKPLAPETTTFLKSRFIAAGAPLYIRIFKEESELEIWKERRDGRFVHVKTYPICTWSGTLGPKQVLGDHMTPEGFYNVGRDGLKPDSAFHLALNIGYPNPLDRALGRTGDFIMVHGNCKSVGCFAMTDGLIEEIYAFVREALEAGQAAVPIHVFPFRMTDENFLRHAAHPAFDTWAPLLQAYQDFDATRLPPRVAICSKRYVVNPIWTPDPLERADPAAACPGNPGKLLAPVSQKLSKRLAAKPLVVAGVKGRTLEDITNWDDSEAKAAIATFKSRDEARLARKAADDERQADIGGFRPLLAR